MIKMTTLKRFVARAKKECAVDLDPSTFRRIYAVYWQKAAGAWSWSMRIRGQSAFERGSQWSLTTLNKTKQLIFDGEEFYPND